MAFKPPMQLSAAMEETGFSPVRALKSMVVLHRVVGHGYLLSSLDSSGGSCRIRISYPSVPGRRAILGS
jgi:hypothetical protein